MYAYCLEISTVIFVNHHHRSVFEEQIVQLTGTKILKLSVKGGSSVLTQYSFQNTIHNLLKALILKMVRG